MEIGKIMQRLNESRNADQGVKTASDNTSKKASVNADELRTALRETIASAPSTEKTASVATPQSDPTGDLLKLAEDLTAAEEEALMKQAAVYGAAMCDGYMARYQQYMDAAAQTKTANQATVTTAPAADADLNSIKTAAANDPEFVKFAEENPDLVKEAVDLGYQQTMQQLVKTAEDTFQNGYADGMREMHKVASECYKAGAITINNVLREMQTA